MANEKTEWVFDTQSKPNKEGGGLPRLGEHSRDAHDETAYIDRGGDSRAPAAGDATELHLPQSSDDAAEASFGADIDPVTGWLVIVRGPGRGISVALGVGSNSVGRDRGERAAIPFGDKLISQKAHANIVYDDKSRQFFIRHADGKNLTRLNGELVGDLRPLNSGDLVEFGNETCARFMAFCGADFDWSDS